MSDTTHSVPSLQERAKELLVANPMDSRARTLIIELCGKVDEIQQMQHEILARMPLPLVPEEAA